MRKAPIPIKPAPKPPKYNAVLALCVCVSALIVAQVDARTDAGAYSWLPLYRKLA